mgnify:CR=1 FL=1
MVKGDSSLDDTVIKCGAELSVPFLHIGIVKTAAELKIRIAAAAESLIQQLYGKIAWICHLIFSLQLQGV